MTTQQINIAIAESLGWHHFIINDEYGNDRALRPGQEFSMGCIFTDIPNYTADLNAMHEVEKTLSLDERDKYYSHLWNICDKMHRMASVGGWLVPTATALQRAEVYLRTIGKWNEKD